MPNSTHDPSPRTPSLPDRDVGDAWLLDAVRARTLTELRAVAKAHAPLTARDQAWCRALATHLDDVDAVAMRELVGQLGPIADVTGNGSGR